MNTDYYISIKSKLLKDFDKTAKHMRKVVASHYEADFADTLLKEARREYESLIPELPYIGGKGSFLTKNLIASGWCLALYRALIKHDKTVEEIGKIIYRTVQEQLNSYPKLLRRLIGRYRFSKFYLAKLKKSAAKSQERQYTGNWVFTVLEGNGEEFDYGIDYTECGICKLFHAHGADEIVPFLCETDFPVSKALGTGLVRTNSLADGSQKCNFRFKRGREVKQD